ncbi:Uncharacterised protein [uncultured Blautia sp.]|nr:Uncharacterised protein [uncultured Blautia sp.]
MPSRILASTVNSTTTKAEVPAGRNFIISAPPRAPMTMMPSRPMLMTPECSEKQPPSATSSRTEAKISVYCSSSNITPSLLPQSRAGLPLPAAFHPAGPAGCS